MKRIHRALAPALSLFIVLAAPGLLPYRAAAQVVGAARVAPAVSGVSGASSRALDGAPALPTAPGLLPGPLLFAAPSVSPAPSLSAAPSPAAVSAPARAAVSLEAVPLRAAALAVRPAASALPALTAGAASLSAAAAAPSPDAPRVALDALFEGSRAVPEALAIAAAPAAARDSRLDPSSGRGPAAGPRWVKTLRAPEAKPAPSLRRTFAVGLLGASIPLAVTYATMYAAHFLGYQFHPSYVDVTAIAAPDLTQALILFAGASVLSPVAEEVIFRGTIQGLLARLTGKLRLGDFVLPALVASVLFVGLHETTDPVLISTRLFHALALSYVYKKEGLFASIAAHGVFNAALSLTLVFAAAGVPALNYAIAPVLLAASLLSLRTLRRQKAAAAEGAVASWPLNGLVALLLAAALLVSYLFLPILYWPPAALLLVIAGVLKIRAGQP